MTHKTFPTGRRIYSVYILFWFIMFPNFGNCRSFSFLNSDSEVLEVKEEALVGYNCLEELKNLPKDIYNKTNVEVTKNFKKSDIVDFLKICENRVCEYSANEKILQELYNIFLPNMVLARNFFKNIYFSGILRKNTISFDNFLRKNMSVTEEKPGKTDIVTQEIICKYVAVAEILQIGVKLRENEGLIEIEMLPNPNFTTFEFEDFPSKKNISMIWNIATFAKLEICEVTADESTSIHAIANVTEYEQAVNDFSTLSLYLHYQKFELKDPIFTYMPDYTLFFDLLQKGNLNELKMGTDYGALSCIGRIGSKNLKKLTINGNNAINIPEQTVFLIETIDELCFRNCGELNRYVFLKTRIFTDVTRRPIIESITTLSTLECINTDLQANDIKAIKNTETLKKLRLVGMSRKTYREFFNFSTLRWITTIEFLEIGDDVCNENVLECIKECRNLKVLILGFIDNARVYTHVLHRCSVLNTLEVLKLKNFLGTMIYYDVLKGFSNLKTLEIADKMLETLDISILEPYKTKLTKLTIEDSSPKKPSQMHSSEKSIALETICLFTELVELKVVGFQGFYEDMHYCFAQPLQSSRLTVLILEKLEIADKEFVKNIKALEVLSLSSVIFENTSLHDVLMNSGFNDTLKSLRLESITNLKTIIEWLSGLKNLESLAILDCQLNNIQAKKLFSSQSIQKSLKYLEISEDLAEGSILNTVFSNLQIRKMKFASGMPFDDAILVEKMPLNSHIEELELEMPGYFKDYRFMKVLEKFTRLRRIRLNHNVIANEISSLKEVLLDLGTDGHIYVEIVSGPTCTITVIGNNMKIDIYKDKNLFEEIKLEPKDIKPDVRADVKTDVKPNTQKILIISGFVIFVVLILAIYFKHIINRRMPEE